MYVSFDSFPEADLTKERESCFTAGANDEKVPQYVTDRRDEHSSNAKALSKTIHLFGDDELKTRHRAKLLARFEQERKWVKHFEACINEHKKGTQVAKLKTELAEARKNYLKEKAKDRYEAEQKHIEAVKKLRVDLRKEWEAELKKKMKPKKHSFWQKVATFFGFKKEEKKEVPAAAPPMVAKEPKDPKDMSAKQKRKFYMLKAAEKNKEAA